MSKRGEPSGARERHRFRQPQAAKWNAFPMNIQEPCPTVMGFSGLMATGWARGEAEHGTSRNVLANDQPAASYVGSLGILQQTAGLTWLVAPATPWRRAARAHLIALSRLPRCYNATSGSPCSHVSCWVPFCHLSALIFRSMCTALDRCASSSWVACVR
jgi:hypothetical protein